MTNEEEGEERREGGNNGNNTTTPPTLGQIIDEVIAEGRGEQKQKLIVKGNEKVKEVEEKKNVEFLRERGIDIEQIKEFISKEIGKRAGDIIPTIAEPVAFEEGKRLLSRIEIRTAIEDIKEDIKEDIFEKLDDAFSTKLAEIRNLTVANLTVQTSKIKTFERNIEAMQESIDNTKNLVDKVNFKHNLRVFLTDKGFTFWFGLVAITLLLSFSWFWSNNATIHTLTKIFGFIVLGLVMVILIFTLLYWIREKIIFSGRLEKVSRSKK